MYLWRTQLNEWTDYFQGRPPFETNQFNALK